MRQMRDFAQEAINLAKGRSHADIEIDRVFQLALLHLVQMVGEAANRVPPDKRPACPEVPWNDIVGMRHRLVHGYDVVDTDLVWRTVTEDLPDLVRILDKLLPPPGYENW